MFRGQQNVFEDVIGKLPRDLEQTGLTADSILVSFSESDGRELDLGELGIHDGCVGED